MITGCETPTDSSTTAAGKCKKCIDASHVLKSDETCLALASGSRIASCVKYTSATACADCGTGK